MASQTTELILLYKAETDEFTKELNAVIDAQGELSDEATKTAKAVQAAVDAETKAAAARKKLINEEIAAIEKLNNARKKTYEKRFTDEQLARQKNLLKLQAEDKKATEAAIANLAKLKESYKQTATEADKASKKTSDSFNDVGKTVSNIGRQIGGAIAAAFTVDAVLKFGKATIDAFLEAEEVSSRLKFAITEINNESESTFTRLVKQAETLQKISIFDDEDIQKAQTALATFGLTSEQIERLIPRIVDLASANKRDLASTTDTVIRGIEGEQKALKLLGVQLDEVGTEVENYNQILDKTVKFTGSAAEATETLSGHLEQSKSRYSDIQEAIGSLLAGAFTSLKNSVLEALAALIRFDETADEVRKKANANAAAAAQSLVSQFEKEGKSVDAIKAGLSAGVAEAQKNIEKYADAVEQAELKIALIQTGRREATTTEVNNLFKVINLNKDLLINATAIAGAYQDQLDIINEQAASNNRILKTEDLKKLSIEQLNALLLEQKKIGDSISRSNTDLINKQIEEQIKLQKKLDELADKRIGKDEEIIKITSRLSVNQSAYNEEQLQLINLYLKSIEGTQEFRNAVFTLNQELEKKGITDFEKRLDAQNQARIKANDIKPVWVTDYISEIERVISEMNRWIDKNREILDSTSTLFSSITDLSRVFTESTITDLQRQLEATQTTADQEQKALDDSLNKRLISEADYRKKSDAIELQRIATEKKIQAEINKQRRRQAQLDKAAAIFEITLQNTINVIKAIGTPPVPNVVLGSLAAGIGAVQLAAAIATPLPGYKKGTKGKKDSGMAYIAEEGKEAVFLPQHTKVVPNKPTIRYADAIDAMIDNNYEKYVYKKHIAPALLKQKREYETHEKATFASNIVNSMTYTGTTFADHDYLRRKGTKITNADEIGAIVAREVAKVLADSYNPRRY